MFAIWFITVVGLVSELLGGLPYWELRIFEEKVLENKGWLKLIVKYKHQEYYGDFCILEEGAENIHIRNLENLENGKIRLKSYIRMENFLLSKLYAKDKIDLTLLNRRITTWRIFRSMQVGNFISSILLFIVMFSYGLFFYLERGKNGFIYMSFIAGGGTFMFIVIYTTAAFVNRAYRRVCDTLFSLLYVTQ